MKRIVALCLLLTTGALFFGGCGPKHRGGDRGRDRRDPPRHERPAPGPHRGPPPRY